MEAADEKTLRDRREGEGRVSVDGGNTDDEPAVAPANKLIVKT